MRVLIAIFCGVLHASCAVADVAELKVLGFSKNGDIFAFQQTGVLGGAGFAYVENHYISTLTGEHIAGSPFVLEDQSGLMTPAQLSKDLSLGFFTERHGISSADLTALSIRLSTDVSLVPYEVNFFLSENEFTQGEPPYSIKIHPKVLPDSDACLPFDTESFGFEIEMNEFVSENISLRAFQSDSRWGCVIDYQISGVYSFQKEDLSDALGIIVRVKLHGFEGPSIRWMAMAFQI